MHSRIISGLRATVVVACLAVIPTAPLTAEDLPDPGDSSLPSMERVTALIERMRIEQKSFKSLRAKFQQRTESEMLVEAELAKGAFFYQAPDKVRWEYFEPTPKIILVNGDQMTTWYFLPRYLSSSGIEMMISESASCPGSTVKLDWVSSIHDAAGMASASRFNSPAEGTNTSIWS